MINYILFTYQDIYVDCMIQCHYMWCSSMVLNELQMNLVHNVSRILTTKFILKINALFSYSSYFWHSIYISLHLLCFIWCKWQTALSTLNTCMNFTQKLVGIVANFFCCIIKGLSKNINKNQSRISLSMEFTYEFPNGI